mgnify:CR=1 FL=1
MTALSVAPAALDYMFRSVPEAIWYLGGKVVVVLSVLIYLTMYPPMELAVYYLASAIASAAVAAAALLGYMGMGDLWATLVISLSLPVPPGGSGLPPSLLIILVASLAEVVTRLFASVVVSRRLGGRRSGLGVIVPCNRAGELSWWFPPSKLGSEDIFGAVAKACESSDEVKLEPGMPFVLFLLIAIPVTLILELLM